MSSHLLTPDSLHLPCRPSYPLSCPCPPRGDSAAAPQSCCSTSCPSSPALYQRRSSCPTASRWHQRSPLPSCLPRRRRSERSAGLLCPVVLSLACATLLPTLLPVARCLPAAPAPSPGPGCLLFSFALQLCGRALSSDLGSRPLPATPAVPGHSRVGAVTAVPPVVCPPLLWQGFCLPEQPPVPRAPGAPRGHRQREGRGEGLPACGCPGHLG